MDRQYCCPLECVLCPRTVVDGMACTRCRSSGFCRCDCAENHTREYLLSSDDKLKPTRLFCCMIWNSNIEKYRHIHRQFSHPNWNFFSLIKNCSGIEWTQVDESRITKSYTGKVLAEEKNLVIFLNKMKRRESDLKRSFMTHYLRE